MKSIKFIAASSPLKDNMLTTSTMRVIKYLKSIPKDSVVNSETVMKDVSIQKNSFHAHLDSRYLYDNDYKINIKGKLWWGQPSTIRKLRKELNDERKS